MHSKIVDFLGQSLDGASTYVAVEFDTLLLQSSIGSVGCLSVCIAFRTLNTEVCIHSSIRKCYSCQHSFTP